MKVKWSSQPPKRAKHLGRGKWYVLLNGKKSGPLRNALMYSTGSNHKPEVAGEDCHCGSCASYPTVWLGLALWTPGASTWTPPLQWGLTATQVSSKSWTLKPLPIDSSWKIRLVPPFSFFGQFYFWKKNLQGISQKICKNDNFFGQPKKFILEGVQIFNFEFRWSPHGIFLADHWSFLWFHNNSPRTTFTYQFKQFWNEFGAPSHLFDSQNYGAQSSEKKVEKPKPTLRFKGRETWVCPFSKKGSTEKNPFSPPGHQW